MEGVIIGAKMSSPSHRSVLCFYSKSADKFPGIGAGEVLYPDDKEKLRGLALIPHWRRMLSNFYSTPTPLELDGMTWASVEHYYQGSKFSQHPEFRALFSLESGSKISTDPVLAKAAGGKTGKSKGKSLRPTDVNCDEDFFNGRDVTEMRRAQEAKFCIPVLQNVLLLTRDCVLNHFVGRSAGTITVHGLMEIRDTLRSNTLS